MKQYIDVCKSIDFIPLCMPHKKYVDLICMYIYIYLYINNMYI